MAWPRGRSNNPPNRNARPAYRRWKLQRQRERLMRKYRPDLNATAERSNMRRYRAKRMLQRVTELYYQRRSLYACANMQQRRAWRRWHVYYAEMITHEQVGTPLPNRPGPKPRAL